MAKDLEHEHQKALVRWFDMHFKDHRGRLLAIPNGGHRHIRVAAKLKSEGVRAGVPDLHLPVARGEFNGLWIELKAPGGKPSKSQLDWLHYLNEQGSMAALCVGWKAAKETIESYLAI